MTTAVLVQTISEGSPATSAEGANPTGCTACALARWTQHIIISTLRRSFAGRLVHIQCSSALPQVPGLGIFRLNPVRLVWRSIMVVVITVIALQIPPWHCQPHGRSVQNICHHVCSLIQFNSIAFALL